MGFALRYEELLGENPAGGRGAGHALACVLCGDTPEDELALRCASCGGAIDAVHDMDRALPMPGVNPLETYFGLLPLRERSSIMWLGEGDTPCFRSEHFGPQVGLSNLYLKNESANPTLSTKDRIASVGLSRFSELGVKRFVMASTGNSSTAYARGVQAVGGVEMALFCGHRFRHRLNYPDHSSVRTYLVGGDFVSTGRVARRFAEHTGALAEGGFFNLARREGLKLAYLEAFDQMPVGPEYVFQAVSSGMGLVGAYKGALEYRHLGLLDHLPRFVAAQQSSCAPMARAFAEKEPQIRDRHVVEEPTGPAEAILRGDPTRTYPYVRQVCLDSGGRITAADNDDIRAVRRLLRQTEGLHVCHAGATALAAAVRMRHGGALAENTPVLVNLTGADRAGWSTPTDYHEVDTDWPAGPIAWDRAPEAEALAAKGGRTCVP